MEGFTEKLLDVLLAIIIFVALLGVVVSGLSGFTFSAVNLGGTVYNFGWVPYVLFIIIVVAVVVLVYRYMLKHKK